jgi:GT2 family glycosyltransferase
MISCLTLTWDRFDVTKDTITRNFQDSSGWELEWLVADQGSKDRRVTDFIYKHQLTSYFRQNSKNEGISKAFNQLYLRAKGDVIVLMGSDIVMPHGWIKEMLGYINGVPKVGIVGMDWGGVQIPDFSAQDGICGHWLTPILDRIFGVMMFKRSLIEDIGFFNEGFPGPYGCEDSEFNARVNKAGYRSLYVPAQNFKSFHAGVGQQDQGAYREMKNKSLMQNTNFLGQRLQEISNGDFRVSLPDMREPV